MVALFAIDSNSDYLNPTTWTGKTEFHFASRSIAPQFRVGGGQLSAGTRYEMPLQLLLSDAGEFAGAITAIMQAWVKVNHYQVDDTLKVRTPQEAFVLAVDGHRQLQSWKPAMGYEHHQGSPFIYVGNNPIIAYYALLDWCPKQLSWVKNPTQGAHSEQQHFNQYSVYCYHNRKIQCLDRLFKKTGDPLFAQLRDRVLQMNFYTQVTDGPYRGSVTEAIADPWLERNSGFEWRGSPYTSELVSDLMLQLIEMGLVKKP